MSSPDLLITGVTGFIGFKVLLDALKDGYTVRAALRSISKSNEIISHPKVKALNVGDKLSFVEVPDISKDDAYEEAVHGVTYIIHLASPLPSPFLDPQEGIYEPTVKGVTNMLNSALKAQQTLKKLVITSTALANTPFPPHPTEDITAESREANPQGPFTAIVPAYRAGKIAALNATDKFVKEKNPSFAVVNILPSFVFGPDDKASKLEDLATGTNRLLLSIITGGSAKMPMQSGAAHVYDVAKVHLLALKDGVTGDFGVTKANSYDDAWEIVSQHFPKAVEAGIFSQGHQATVPLNWNAQKTEAALGITLKTFQDIVLDFAGQYLELSGKEKA